MKIGVFVSLSLFAFVLFYVTGAPPARPAPVAETPAVELPAAAPQDGATEAQRAPRRQEEPRVNPAGIPTTEAQRTPRRPEAPQSSAKPKRPNYKMFSRAYVRGRDEVETEVTDP